MPDPSRNHAVLGYSRPQDVCHDLKAYGHTIRPQKRVRPSPPQLKSIRDPSSQLRQSRLARNCLESNMDMSVIEQRYRHGIGEQSDRHRWQGEPIEGNVRRDRLLFVRTASPPASFSASPRHGCRPRRDGTPT